MTDHERDTEPGPDDARTEDTGQDHPAQEAHGGSMAPGLVDDVGRPVATPPPAGSRTGEVPD